MAAVCGWCISSFPRADGKILLPVLSFGLNAGLAQSPASVVAVSGLLKKVFGRSEAEAGSTPPPPTRDNGVQGLTTPGELCQACFGEHPSLPDELAAYDPPHEWCEAVKEHKRNEQYDAALAILDKCILVEESHTGGVAPWFYEQAAIIFHKVGDRDAEVAVLRRFAAQPHAPGALPPKLLERLSKLEAGE